MTALLLLLLSACGRDTLSGWQRWQENLRQASEIRFSAQLCSLTEDDALRFAADITAEGDSVTMTLTAPETLRGMSIVTRSEGADIVVEDMSLSLTALRHDTISPAGGAALLLKALRSGHILYTAEEQNAERAAFTGPGDETLTLWRDAAGVPVCAEIARDGKTELRLSITDWQTKE